MKTLLFFFLANIILLSACGIPFEGGYDYDTASEYYEGQLEADQFNDLDYCDWHDCDDESSYDDAGCVPPAGEELTWNPPSYCFSGSSGSSQGTGNCELGCTVPPTGCNIKGNISVDTGERIYHVPGQTFYNETVICPEYGERWFCTESEAINNGWRKAYN